MGKPSVLFINRVYPPVRGATGRMLRDLARAFVRDGWEVTVVTAGLKNARERDGPIRIFRLCSNRKNIFAYGWLWLRMVWMGLTLPRHDLVVSMTDPPLLVVAGRIIARRKKSRHIHWCHDLYPDLLPALGVRLPGPVMRYLFRTARSAMKACDKIVVIGRCMAKTLTHKGLEAGRITVIPNWPDEELLANGRRRKPGGPQALEAMKRAMEERLREAGGKPYEQLLRDTEPKFRVLYSGTLGRAHPVRTVLEAAAILQMEHPEIEFVFVGDGRQFDWLARERARLDLENIRFLPWQPSDRLRDLMESGDLHLISMKHDAAGLLVPCKLYSALAVGRPCILIGPEETETAQIIEDFRAGTVIPQGQPQRLAEAIRSYRLSSETWFQAHEGALEAGRIFVPAQSINVWLDRARRTVANVSAAPAPEKRDGRGKKKAA